MDIAHFLFGIFGGFSFSPKMVSSSFPFFFFFASFAIILAVEVLSLGFFTNGSSVSLSLSTRKRYCSIPLLGPNVCITKNHLSLWSLVESYKFSIFVCLYHFSPKGYWYVHTHLDSACYSFWFSWCTIFSTLSIICSIWHTIPQHTIVFFFFLSFVRVIVKFFCSCGRITFKRIIWHKSTEEFSGIPYVMTLLNCLLSAW